MFRVCDAVLLDMRGTKCASITLDDIGGLLLTYSPDKLLNDSCKQESMFIVLKAIEKGATNWDNGLYGACEGGHIEIANLMIESGPTHCRPHGEQVYCRYARCTHR